MSNKRVVITGIGVFSPVGKDKESFKKSIIGCRCGIFPIEGFDLSGFKIKLGGEIKGYRPEEYFNSEEIGLWDKSSQYALIVTKEALEDAKLELDKLDKERVGTVIGMSSSGAEYFLPYIFDNKDLAELDIGIFRGLLNGKADAVSYKWNFMGPKSTISTACTSSGNAIGYGSDLIKSNKADIILAVGTEPLSILSFAGFYNLQTMSNAPCSPFSEPLGMTIGEGAGCFILEDYELAKKRKAKIYGEILGYGLSNDAYHLTAPDITGSGAQRAMKFALQDANLEENKIEYINTHGTGTAHNDIVETNAMKSIFPEIYNIPVSSTKSYFGHAIGAASILELAATLLCVEEGVLLPTINFTQPRKGCDLDYIPNQVRHKEISYFMSNNFGFGGNNFSIIIKRGLENNLIKNGQDERVVITGLGVVSPVGVGKEEFWQSLRENKVNVSCLKNKIESTFDKHKEPLTYFNNKPIETFQACMVNNFNAKKIVRHLNLRRLDKLSQYATVGAFLALNDGGIKIASKNCDLTGLIMGISKGTWESLISYGRSLRANPASSSVIDFPHTLANATTAKVSINLGLKGYNSTITNGVNSSLNSFLYGYEILKKGINQCLIVGAADEISVIPWLIVYDKLGMYCRTYDKFKVYDVKSNGFLLGEGSVMVVLETLSSAQARKAKIYAEVLGYGMTSDTYSSGSVDISGNQLSRAMKIALREARFSNEQIDCVYISSWGQKEYDNKDISAFNTTFRDLKVPICNIVPYCGYSEASIGLLNLIGALYSFSHSELLPIKNTSEFISDNFFVKEYLKKEINTCMVEGFSESGANYALILRRYQG